MAHRTHAAIVKSFRSTLSFGHAQCQPGTVICSAKEKCAAALERPFQSNLVMKASFAALPNVLGSLDYVSRPTFCFINTA